MHNEPHLKGLSACLHKADELRAEKTQRNADIEALAKRQAALLKKHSPRGGVCFVCNYDPDYLGRQHSRKCELVNLEDEAKRLGVGE